MKNKFLLTYTLLGLGFYATAQNDSIPAVSKQTSDLLTTNEEDTKDTAEELNTIIIDFQRSIKLTQKASKYEVDLQGTNFKDFPTTWDGLKNIPLLHVQDNEALKINHKSAIVEINGIRTEMSSSELETFLKNMDPADLKKVEMTTNPRAMYDSSVQAVINIVLKQPTQQYKLSAYSSQWVATKPSLSSGGTFSQNINKWFVYTGYNFNYGNTHLHSNTDIFTTINDWQRFKTHTQIENRDHDANLRVSFQENEKNDFHFTGNVSFDNNTSQGKMTADFGNRKTISQSNGLSYQFSQIWKSKFSDKLSMKMGSYQVFSNSKDNLNVLEGVNQQQKTENFTPILIGFADFTNQNKWGQTDFGSRFHSIKQSNENRLFTANNSIDSPFYYNEKVLSFYANHSVELAENKTLSLGIRSESTFADYSFKNSALNQEFSDTKNYTNLLYNIGYYWNNEKSYHSLAFRKTISRPNYSYINPFQSISEDIIYTAGDKDIKPSLNYELSYELMYNKFTFSLASVYNNNFISRFFEEDNGNIVTTYKNFKHINYTYLNTEYNERFFNRKWNFRPGIFLAHINVWDKSYDIKPSSPMIFFNIHNNINLGKDFTAYVFFQYTPTFKDGLLKHHSKYNSSINLMKKHKNFQFTIYAKDIFKGNRVKTNTLVDNYFYGSSSYYDNRNVGFQVRYTFVGKSFKDKRQETINDDAINRL